MLQAKGACPNQVAVFAKEWPRGATVTLKNCERAAKLGLDVHWVSNNLLPKNLDDAYEAQRKPLCDAYVAQWQSLDDAYDAQCWQVFYQIAKGV